MKINNPVANLLRRIGSGSFSKKRAALAGAALTASISMLLAPLVFPLTILGDNNDVQTFTVDVSLTAPYYQNNVNPAQAPADFSPGDTFIQDGNVYPAGTILPSLAQQFDPTTSGSIGTFRSRGTFTITSADFELATKHKKAPPDLAITTEMFTLLANKSLLMTDGNWPNAYFSMDRAVVGGTGTFRNVVGEVHEENIGENKLGFCNFRVTFKLRSVGDR